MLKYLNTVTMLEAVVLISKNTAVELTAAEKSIGLSSKLDTTAVVFLFKVLILISDRGYYRGCQAAALWSFLVKQTKVVSTFSVSHKNTLCLSLRVDKGFYEYFL